MPETEVVADHPIVPRDRVVALTMAAVATVWIVAGAVRYPSGAVGSLAGFAVAAMVFGLVAGLLGRHRVPRWASQVPVTEGLSDAEDATAVRRSRVLGLLIGLVLTSLVTLVLLVVTAWVGDRGLANVVGPAFLVGVAFQNGLEAWRVGAWEHRAGLVVHQRRRSRWLALLGGPSHRQLVAVRARPDDL